MQYRLVLIDDTTEINITILLNLLYILTFCIIFIIDMRLTSRCPPR